MMNLMITIHSTPLSPNRCKISSSPFNANVCLQIAYLFGVILFIGSMLIIIFNVSK